jgi:hypothetical protein
MKSWMYLLIVHLPKLSVAQTFCRRVVDWSYDWRINEKCIGKDMEGSGRALI